MDSELGALDDGGKVPVIREEMIVTISIKGSRTW
jgi:hypothetical protein